MKFISTLSVLVVISCLAVAADNINSNIKFNEFKSFKVVGIGSGKRPPITTTIGSGKRPPGTIKSGGGKRMLSFMS
jgi:hypothetical protein